MGMDTTTCLKTTATRITYSLCIHRLQGCHLRPTPASHPRSCSLHFFLYQFILRRLQRRCQRCRFTVQSGTASRAERSARQARLLYPCVSPTQALSALTWLRHAWANSAAGNFLSPIEATSANAFSSVLDIDLKGTWNTVKAALPFIKGSNEGAFIAISATLHYTGTMLQAPMSAAKAGIDALSRAMAVEFGPLGIRCNVIAPVRLFISCTSSVLCSYTDQMTSGTYRRHAWDGQTQSQRWSNSQSSPCIHNDGLI